MYTSPVDHTLKGLRYLDSIRTATGQPVVDLEVLVAELCLDLSSGFGHGDPDPRPIVAAARDCSVTTFPMDYSLHLMFSARLDAAYCILIGQRKVGYHPDWLNALPSEDWAMPLFPRFCNGKRY